MIILSHNRIITFNNIGKSRDTDTCHFSAKFSASSYHGDTCSKACSSVKNMATRSVFLNITAKCCPLVSHISDTTTPPTLKYIHGRKHYSSSTQHLTSHITPGLLKRCGKYHYHNRMCMKTGKLWQVVHVT